ncbi:MAG: class I SAM-dependent methyltransferase [Chitinophagaceae bacterium]|nr:class I SAM-dependent methyltransferase [Chitinophagaceae bacterium]
MERKYWEKMAPAYDDEIFDVLKNDRKGLIRSALEQRGCARKSVIDVGCAVGKWLPLLADNYGRIEAVDISSGNLAIARQRYGAIKKITFSRSDMSKGVTPYKGFDVALCVNAVLTDSLKKRIRFFSNLHACLRKEGTLILVVPALESWLLTRIIQHRWKIDKKLFAGSISDKTAADRYHGIQQGNAEIDQVATKHYLADELILLLQQEGFKPEQPAKLEYDWSTEFIKPPEWLDSPRPWDWLVIARKIR